MIKKNFIIIILTVIILIILGFLGFTYTADVAALDNAKVSIKDIRFQEIGLTSCKLKIFIEISNPSDRYISGLTADFEVFINENYVGSGSVSRISIPAQSNREKGVTITIFYTNAAEAVIDGIQKGYFDLSINGDASGDVLFGLITVTNQIYAVQTYP